jgi:alpha-D-ribose 1-methylphosphonate 5-triphosphate synthase subunit PhnH
MIGPDLGRLGAGFDSPALASQQVFRAALEALSRPGRIARIDALHEAPAELEPAACALALALLDQDTTLWLSPAIRAGQAGAYLRFHTGCRVTEVAAEADFAIAEGHELPPLEAFSAGSEEYPDRSATLIAQVGELREGEGWTLAGPGIRATARVKVAGLPADFVRDWQANHARFPRGVDVFLACGRELCGLPRTTRVEG